VRYTTPDDCICSCLTIESILLNRRTTQRRVDVHGVYPTPNTTSMSCPRLFLPRALHTTRSIRGAFRKRSRSKEENHYPKPTEYLDAGSNPGQRAGFFHASKRELVCNVRILAGFMRLLGYELKIRDPIESCHIAEGSESGVEFRETTPIREINGTKNQKVRGAIKLRSI
jgi:hypothetical protein